MTAYANQMKAYIEKYMAESGNEGLLDPHAVAEWAYHRGLHKPSVRTIVDAIASDIARFFREEYRTSPNGQRYRAKHAVRVKTGDKTMSLWADMDDQRAPREHFVRSFAQRRQQIVGDCFQLKTDVDVYNGKFPSQAPIQIPLDFTYDVEELQLPINGKKAA
ncbi:hypothetical protein [Aquitalea sp.]|uniref:hypothetical protein n=1 Tax=Aquitalea sp. TaxID=1872623 RepID=UPI00258D344C|nr:hypothetical protein [Aquitalea sp.]